MTYEELPIEADGAGLIVKEAPLLSGDGRCKGCRIAIRKDIPTLQKKADTLAEEMGHFYTTVGDILEQDTVNSCKQERSARLWAYNKQIGLQGIIWAYQHQCRNPFEAAEYLNVSEETFTEAIEFYRKIYGHGIMIDNYFIQFEPNLQVYEYFQI